MLFSAKDSQGSQSLTLGFTATPLPGLGARWFQGSNGNDQALVRASQ